MQALLRSVAGCFHYHKVICIAFTNGHVADLPCIACSMRELAVLFFCP